METPWRRHPFDVLVALGVHTDRAPEPASSTVQATRDGACSDTEDQSHISAGPALEIHQVQHLPKRRRKPPDSPFESRVQDLAHHDRLGTVVRLQPLDDQGGRVRHHGWSRPASRPVDVSVAHNRQQPRPRVAAIEAVDAPIGTQQRVLHQVVTIGMMAGDRPRHPPRAPPAPGRRTARRPPLHPRSAPNPHPLFGTGCGHGSSGGIPYRRTTA